MEVIARRKRQSSRQLMSCRRMSLTWSEHTRRELKMEGNRHLTSSNETRRGSMRRTCLHTSCESETLRCAAAAQSLSPAHRRRLEGKRSAQGHRHRTCLRTGSVLRRKRLGHARSSHGCCACSRLPDATKLRQTLSEWQRVRRRVSLPHSKLEPLASSTEDDSRPRPDCVYTARVRYF